MKKILSFVLLVFAILYGLAGAAHAANPGKNGNVVITVANTIVNQSTTLSAAAAAGASSISVTSTPSLSMPSGTGSGALTAGDVILIYQANGASIDLTDPPTYTPTYGNITAYGGAGNYELQTVASVSGTTINLAGQVSAGLCTVGLKNSYASGAQVIRVPQYQNLTVNAGASIATSAWNGSLGGVVAFLVSSTFTLNGTVTVAGLGFRGGILQGNDLYPGLTTIPFADNNNPSGGQKGEGIASGAGGTFGATALTYSNPGGNYDTGAPANGGGGGGSHNAGGGGGGNAAAALTPYCSVGTATYSTATTNAIIWCGQGVMPSGVTGAAAWTLDPGYIANGGYTAHVGGGRGGYTYSANAQDPTLAGNGPGQTSWGGDNRRAMGGWGGRPLQQNLAQTLFFGGGGGSGGNNNGTGGVGGAGGGIVLIQVTGSVAGTGAINANGAAGASTTGNGNDAPGGGGAGGTIVLVTPGGSVGALTANGGAGGLQTIAANEAEGPGGGGGGGLVAATIGTQSATGGAGGTTNSPGILVGTTFPRNGATDGSPGVTAQGTASVSNPAGACTNLTIAKTDGVLSVIAGSTTSYTITVANLGPSNAPGATVKDPAATGLNCTAVSCAVSAGTATCPAAPTIATLQSTGLQITPTFNANSTLTFRVTCGVTATGQ